MAESLGKAVLEISVDDRQYKTAMANIEREAGRTASAVEGINKALNFAGAVAAAGAAIQAIRSVVGAVEDLGKRGAAVADMSGSFNTLSARAGETADVMLGALREGVKGTMSDFELMKLANKALGAGLIKSSQDMGTLAAGARALGKATGQDTSEAFEILTTAIASGRTAQLKQLGLFVDSKVATEEFARAHGKTVAQLTDAERAAALSAATLGALKDRMALIAPDAADFGEQVDAIKAAFSNLYDRAAVVASNVLPEIGKAFTDAMPSLGSFGLSFKDVANIIANVMVNASRFVFNYLGGMVKGVQAATDGITTSAMLLWDTLTGKLSGKEAWNALKETASTALGSIEGAMVQAYGTTIVWKDYLEQTKTAVQTVGVAATTAATQVQTSNATILLSQQQLNQMMGQLLTEDVTTRATAEAAVAALVEQSRQRMLTAENAYLVATQQMASAAGFQTRAELEATANKALETYNRMKDSGLYTAAQIREAWENAEDAKRKAAGETVDNQDKLNASTLDGAAQMLTTLGGQNKAAGIAAAIINTYSAITRALAAPPGFPWNAASVAAAGAMGFAQVAKIKSSKPGFATGTPGLDFANFGKEMGVNLHGNEAVIPQGSGHLLAGEIAAAMPDDDGAVGELKALRADLAELPFMMTRSWKAALATT